MLKAKLLVENVAPGGKTKAKSARVRFDEGGSPNVQRSKSPTPTFKGGKTNTQKGGGIIKR